MSRLILCCYAACAAACAADLSNHPADAATVDDAGSRATATLPLLLVTEADLPGRAVRFDYQDVDTVNQQLVVTHMNDSAVLFLDLATGAVKKQLTGIPTPRGVVVASEIGRSFVTSTPGHLVIIDNQSLTEVGRVGTGSAPDGNAWDPTDQIVGVSEQAEGALSLLANAGSGPRKVVSLGVETGNVVFDSTRSRFWITVVRSLPPDQLVAVDPVAGKVTLTIDLPGCGGAHGLRLHPDAQSAFVACEGNDQLARVELEGAHAVVTTDSGSGPDVMALDLGLGWLYVAAETGDLTIFDIKKPGLQLIGHDNPGPHSHSVSVDQATHRVFFPLMTGTKGTPSLRIFRPSGI